MGAALAGEEESGLMAKLVLYLPDGTVHDIVLDKERVTIGRRPDNDVCLPYPAVSGEHAQVVTILDDSFLEDLGSTNGTLVNGKAIVKHFLRDNDLIDIGRQRLMYFNDNATRVDPLPPDVARREIRGLAEQVQRAAHAREERRKPLAAPGAGGVGTTDPLSPDEDLLAEIESGAFPGERKSAPPPAPANAPTGNSNGARTPAAKTPSAQKAPPPVPPTSSPGASRRVSAVVASRLASTWSYEEPAAAPERGAPSPIGQADDAVAPSRATAPAPAPAYWIRVLSGPSAGRELALTGDDYSVGRVGTQVARIAQQEGRWRLTLVEGAAPVTLNGAPVPPEGLPITAGDRFEVAGTELAFERR
jgi:predicted component of type VI protein secretion system